MAITATGASNYMEMVTPILPMNLMGEKGKLFVVLKRGRKLTKEKIEDHCIKNLAKFKIPTVIEFMSALPRNATGKVLKRALKKEQ